MDLKVINEKGEAQSPLAASEDLFGRAPTDFPSVASRGRSRIDRVEIAAGRQNVETAARRFHYGVT